ncbi:hypothetical protein N0V90_002331 [Kalmusia sp. IMI 367209]|nr:hypothetical protein N0V90_002331 [Kalmusia sp. IMI 367209]
MDPTCEEIFEEYYHKCLKLCRQELSEAARAGNDEPLYYIGFALSATSVIPLATHLDSCWLTHAQLQRLLPWTSHLNVMMANLKSQGELDYIDPQDECFLELLHALGTTELPTHILNRKTQHHHFWYQYCRGGIGIEEGCGLPCSLLDLLSQLGNPSMTDALLSWQAPEGDLAQIYSWDATRFAAIIRAFEDSKPTQDLDVAAWLMYRGISLQDLVDSVLACIRQCLPSVPPELGHFKQTLLFPLVMAASQRTLLSVEAKDFIYQTLQHEASERNYFHYQGVVRIIQAHWNNDADTIEETARRMDVELCLW